ncbi:metalloregulator ArsR/SmtB family transcription factor [Corynebacterium imitans]|uniref:ArsR/SmtB family transcription factor n=1 Tax=Corynebacterium imitans TaxID=156978 RepID=UPI00254C1946|nr:metalloregulator ArsR/SmtB family transcription factor [Corynebacterium imitans]MDK8306174.1 metalloregulator ArsR/SmtB family transcription factor [Corynebacterium imitans]MDK8637190.1 metalloregulator ArsR/SmtB family transcription factor [Corynebacterium imitans]MDK8772137.1 metalloregulator ArsR/SmtB family transcription factor [Corynebacterium imitans]
MYSPDHPAPNLDLTAGLISALDSRTRIEILLLLAERNHVVREIVEKLGRSQPSISQHLKVLKSLRLVAAYRRGREIIYSLPRMEIIDVIYALGKVAEDTLPDPSEERKRAKKSRKPKKAQRTQKAQQTRASQQPHDERKHEPPTNAPPRPVYVSSAIPLEEYEKLHRIGSADNDHEARALDSRATVDRYGTAATHQQPQRTDPQARPADDAPADGDC